MKRVVSGTLPDPMDTNDPSELGVHKPDWSEAWPPELWMVEIIPRTTFRFVDRLMFLRLCGVSKRMRALAEEACRGPVAQDTLKALGDDSSAYTRPTGRNYPVLQLDDLLVHGALNRDLSVLLTWSTNRLKLRARQWQSKPDYLLLISRVPDPDISSFAARKLAIADDPGTFSMLHEQQGMFISVDDGLLNLLKLLMCRDQLAAAVWFATYTTTKLITISYYQYYKTLVIAAVSMGKLAAARKMKDRMTTRKCECQVHDRLIGHEDVPRLLECIDCVSESEGADIYCIRENARARLECLLDCGIHFSTHVVVHLSIVCPCVLEICVNWQNDVDRKVRDVYDPDIFRDNAYIRGFVSSFVRNQ